MIQFVADYYETIAAWLGLGATLCLSAGIHILSWRKKV